MQRRVRIAIFAILSKDNTEVKEWLREVWYFTLGYSFKVHYPLNIDASNACYDWTFQQTFDFTDRGTIIVSLQMDRGVCTDNFTFIQNEEDSLLWVSALCVLLSLINFIAIWHYFYGMAEHLRKL